MPLLGVDLSSNNPSFDFALAYRQGVRVVYIKLGGDNIPRYVSSSYAWRVDQARAAGMIVGHYWVTGKHDPEAAAQFFVRNLRNVQSSDFFVLDNENLDQGNFYSDNEATRWIRTVQSLTGGAAKRVFMYASGSPLMSSSWAGVRSTSAQALVAWYGRSPFNLPIPFGDWSAAQIGGHQYTSSGAVGGAYPVDLNSFADHAFEYTGAAVSSVTALTNDPRPLTQEEIDDMTATPDARIIRDYVTENTSGKTTTALIYPDGTAVRLSDKDDVTSACAAFQKTFNLPETIDRSNPANRNETDPRKVYGIQVTNKEWAAFFAAYPASKKIGF